jgi:hypothetical protein
MPTSFCPKKNGFLPFEELCCPGLGPVGSNTGASADKEGAERKKSPRCTTNREIARTKDGTIKGFDSKCGS